MPYRLKMSGMNEELDWSWINCSNTSFQVRLDWNYPASDLELEEFLETKTKQKQRIESYHLVHGEQSYAFGNIHCIYSP